MYQVYVGMELTVRKLHGCGGFSKGLPALQSANDVKWTILLLMKLLLLRFTCRTEYILTFCSYSDVIYIQLVYINVPIKTNAIYMQ